MAGEGGEGLESARLQGVLVDIACYRGNISHDPMRDHPGPLSPPRPVSKAPSLTRFVPQRHRDPHSRASVARA
jgi:hypothetical protein